MVPFSGDIRKRRVCGFAGLWVCGYDGLSKVEESSGFFGYRAEEGTSWFGVHASQVVVLRHSGCACECKCCWAAEMGLLGFRKPLDPSRILPEGWAPRPGGHDRVLYGEMSPSWLWSNVGKT